MLSGVEHGNYNLVAVQSSIQFNCLPGVNLIIYTVFTLNIIANILNLCMLGNFHAFIVVC